MSVLMATEKPESSYHKVANRQIQPQEQFRSRIAEEWRRSERSGRPALLVLVDGLEASRKGRDAFLDAMNSSCRDTDVLGWFQTDVTFGAIYLELGEREVGEAREAILHKVRNRVLSLTNPFSQDMYLTAYVLPPYSGNSSGDKRTKELPESLRKAVCGEGWFRSAIKRLVDICGSLLLLMTLSPFMIAMAACVRFTSVGPALFRQMRTGLGGRPFVLYKFRTMKINCDEKMHQDYVKQFITGKAEKNSNDTGQQIYKLTNDPRVTPIGKFLRRSSLDELPQLWNVLRGDMSLVGPRPPLPYEVESFGLWHRRRVYQLKPGLTGLWQVRGRCRCSFDEMIRMDLQHGQPHSLGLYFKVLLETPIAVFHQRGAQ